MKKQAMARTAPRKLVLRAESIVTLTSRQLIAVAGGDLQIQQSPLSGCTNPPTKQQD